MKTKNFLIILSMMLMLAVNAFAAVNGDQISVNLLNQNPDPASAGDIVELRLGIENLGDEVTENYNVEIVPTYPFTALQGESLVQEAGRIDDSTLGDNTKILRFKVRVDKDAIAGQYNIRVLTYEDGERNPNEMRLFGIEVESRESAEIIYIDQVELLPGQITPMKFTINNVGSSPLRELTFYWENEDGIILPVGSDNTRYVKYIDVGDKAELSYDVLASANADPDLYKLKLHLEYENPINSTTKTIVTTAGVYVGGKTDFDVTYSGSSNGETSFSISNIGSVQAGSVTVRIPQQPGWRVTGSNSVIIGNLNKGDYTIASFALQSPTMNQTGIPTGGPRPGAGTRNFNQTAPRIAGNTLKLDIVYTDTRGNRNTVIKEVQVSTSTQSGMPAMGNQRFQRQSTSSRLLSSLKWIGLGAAVVAVLLIIRKRHRKGRMKDPDYTYGMAMRDLLPGKKKK
jgi:hypothetical protein